MTCLFFLGWFGGRTCKDMYRSNFFSSLIKSSVTDTYVKYPLSKMLGDQHFTYCFFHVLEYLHVHNEISWAYILPLEYSSNLNTQTHPRGVIISKPHVEAVFYLPLIEVQRLAFFTTHPPFHGGGILQVVARNQK